jgi:acid phosphatase type 7
MKTSRPLLATVASIALLATGTLFTQAAVSGPTVVISDVAKAEGNAGTTAFSFTVTLSGTPKSTATVAYATANGTAIAGSDYAAASGTLSFSKTVKSRVVTVLVTGDTAVEPNETFTVVLSRASGLTIVDGSGLGTILNDDSAPTPSPTPTATPAPTATPTPSPTPTAPPADPVIAVSGDIACDPTASNVSGASLSTCQQTRTSNQLLAGNYAAVLTVGDNQYNDGTLSAYNTVFDPSWGRVKAIMKPVPGNHEYNIPGASGYYAYFGALAGDPTKGYYSYNIGSWHLVALNSNCLAVGGCGAGSPQEQWLRADLASNPATCTLAYWHHPRFSSGSTHGSNTATADLWKALSDHGAEVILAGHVHNYERFAPQTSTGVSDPNGIRQFIVGTGGKSHYGFGTPIANSEARDATSFGILEMTLRPAGYSWRFLPATGSFTDSGTASCR